MPTGALVAILVGLVLASPSAATAGHVKVFVLAGQSNAIGSGTNSADLPLDLVPPQADVDFLFEEGRAAAVADRSLRISSQDGLGPLQSQEDTVGGIFVYAPTGFGPELRLGRDLTDGLGERVALVKFAIGNTSLAVNWDPATNGSLYGQMRSRVDEALASLAGAGDDGEVAGVFWMQGETDTSAKKWASDYAANLTRLIRRLRRDFGNPLLPFVFGRVNGRSPALRSLHVALVQNAQQAVAATVANTALVDTDDLSLADGIHFDSAGVLELGRRFAEAFLAPPRISISRTAAVAVHGDGTTARITVSLTGIRSGADTLVDYATADGTAKAGEAYVATTGTLAFPPGVLTQRLLVPVLAGAASGRAQTFFVDLTQPSNATLGNTRATCIIFHPRPGTGTEAIP